MAFCSVRCCTCVHSEARENSFRARMSIGRAPVELRTRAAACCHRLQRCCRKRSRRGQPRRCGYTMHALCTAATTPNSTNSRTQPDTFWGVTYFSGQTGACTVPILKPQSRRGAPQAQQTMVHAHAPQLRQAQTAARAAAALAASVQRDRERESKRSSGSRHLSGGVGQEATRVASARYVVTCIL